ncbi:unnamed protein product [Calypogeia fissa]
MHLAGYFFDKNNNVLPIENVLRLLPLSIVKVEAMAIPPEQPIGSGEAVEEPMANDDAGPALSSHSDVSLNPMGVIDRLTEEVDAIEEQQ